VPISGHDHRIRGGGYEAHIAGVGATLRRLTADGVDLITSFDPDELRPDMSGALLVPWPNRTACGRYEFGEVAHELPINEPALGNAAHGLIAWLDFTLVDRSLERLHLRGRLAPQPGYPWRLRIDVAFEVTEHGLAQEVSITNESPTAAPVGIGGHPYLLVHPTAPGAVDTWTIEVPAEEVLLVSPDTLIPIGSVPVDQVPELDVRGPRSLRGIALNHAYSRLRRDDAGMTRVTVSDDVGRGVEIAWDERCPWVQIYTADAGADAFWRSAVAVEPMTCPPDALNSKQDLAVVQPGDSLTAGWTIRSRTPVLDASGTARAESPNRGGRSA
jgi:aldose 1-epimerase